MIQGEWIIEEIELCNFGIFKGVQKVYLGDKEIIGIKAIYEEDSERSNRGGKSTFTEAFLYAFTGSCRAKKEVDMIHHGEEFMYVQVKVKNVETEEVKTIKRGRDIKNKGLLSVDWTEKTRDAQEAINELLGIGDDFELTSFFKQADIHGFMEKGPAEKNALLSKWTTTGRWKTPEERVTTDLKLTKDKLKDNDAVKRTIEGLIEHTEPLENEVKKLQVSVAQVSNAQLNGTKLRAKLYGDYIKLKTDKDEASKKISSCESLIEDLEMDLENLNLSRDKLTKIELRLGQLNKEEVNQKALSKAQEDLKKAGVQISKLSDILKKVKTLKAPVCPLLQEPCDRLEFTADDLTKMENEIKDWKKLEEFSQGIIDKQEKISKTNIEITNLKSQYELTKKMIANDETEKKISGARNELAQYKKDQVVDLSTKIARIKEIDTDLKTMSDEVTEANKRIGQLEQRIKASNDALNKIDEVTRRSEILRAELEDLNYMAYMFGKNGIQANEIEDNFGTIQDNINFVLESMGTGFTTNFSPDTETDKWEPVCHCGFVFPKGYRKGECEECGSTRSKVKKNEMKIEVCENGVDQKFEQDSGGGKLLISYAVRIGLTMFKREQSRNKFPVLWLDEIDSALDPYFVDQITTSITKVLTKKLGFRQIFMVTHKERIRDAVPDILEVTRYPEGHSKMAFLD